MDRLVDNIEPLPISLVAHSVFCDRRAWLEASGERVESWAIEVGTIDHRRVDERVGERTDRRRSVEVAHRGLGLVGRCDVVELEKGGLRVVEFKSAPLRRRASVTPAQEVQLALQAMCLEDMGYRVIGGEVYFTTQRKAIGVEMTDSLRAAAMDWVTRTRKVVDSNQAPAPLVEDPRCDSCSHAGVCLPHENAEVATNRAISVSDPDGSILNLTTPGSRVTFRSGRILVSKDGEQIASLPIERVQSVVVHGNIDLSSAVIRELMWRGANVVWATFGGRVLGYARSAYSPNGGPRSKQHSLTAEHRLEMARAMIAAKIGNQATQLRRSSQGSNSDLVAGLRTISRDCLAAPTTRHLFGLEGKAASIYFTSFGAMLRTEHREHFMRYWEGRVGRGAKDPLNISLNVCYAALLADVIRAILACGLETHLGVLHSSSRNKPALALDLMEEFRPVVADSAVLGAINNGELKPSMFKDVTGTYRITDRGRRVLLNAYERRVEQEFRHPTFGYKVSWRRAMEVQARMVLSNVDGTRSSYVGVRTR